MDSLTTLEEATEAVHKIVTETYSREQKMAIVCIVKMGVKGSEELLKSQRIKIGRVN